MKIYGRNAVSETIKSGTTIDRMVVAKDADDAGAKRIIASALSRGIKIFYRDKEYLDREVSGKHQGFIAEITDFKYCELDDILQYAKQKEEPPFIVILDGVEDPHNLGSVLRVCECAGVHGVIIPRHRSVSVNETVIKVSSGAAAHIKVAKVVNINETIEQLKKLGVWVFCADMNGESIYETDLTGAAAFVIGGEGSGVKRLTKNICDRVVSLPMRGEINSLNASVACGVVVYEKLRQNLKGL
ncbi:MAG: 23S rRNA (guanosine(2251)-2'-O)-methyltransferase RlmB [Clostridia bacterium]|jgi:23S rRNA (guanosine2251-2'-O)-methyltransferase|nr:23S rRNA (guanosine(2251)-2'-O)-methyltransferase RlmB [Clostridia bacterium]